MFDEVTAALRCMLGGYPVYEGAPCGDKPCVCAEIVSMMMNMRSGTRRYNEWKFSFTLHEERESARCLMLNRLRKALEGLGFFDLTFDKGARSRCVLARVRRWQS